MSIPYLKPTTIKVSNLSEKEITEFYQLYRQYYENVCFENFKTDFYKKDFVMVLRDKTKELRGFSTLLIFKIKYLGRECQIIFSGDTIIEKSFWGTTALTLEFLRNIIKTKLKNPFTPVWWFLISKGYKTYLLLANNFINYYPRYDKETPSEIKQMIHQLADQFYPGHFNQNTGVIEFQGTHEKLKGFVAPVTDELRLRFPKIDFFCSQNSQWAKGNELACVGEVSLLLGIVHPFKVLMKFFSKKKRQRKLESAT